MKQKLIAVLREAARAAVSAFLAALGLAASVTTSGCSVFGSGIGATLN